MTVAAAPFADIEAMLADVTVSMLANVIATPMGGGDAFPAMFDVADTEFFDHAAGADYTLRYAATAASLARGDDLTLSANPLVGLDVVLRVVATPRPLHGGHERVARLAVVPTVPVEPDAQEEGEGG